MVNNQTMRKREALTMNWGNTIARLWIPIMVPPATGPDPVYSILSPAPSISAVEYDLIKLDLSLAREGLVGDERRPDHGPSGVEAARACNGRDPASYV
jgi:hypothetical protein